MTNKYTAADAPVVEGDGLYLASVWSDDTAVANGDALHFGRGDATIDGTALTPSTNVSRVVISKLFAGSFGATVPVRFLFSGTRSHFQVETRRRETNAFVLLDGTDSSEGDLIVQASGGSTTTITDDRTFDLGATRHELHIHATGAGTTVNITAGDDAATYSRVVITGDQWSTVNLTEVDASDIYSAGPTVEGGSAYAMWVHASGQINPIRAERLMMYGGDVVIGENSGINIIAADVYGGSFRMEDPAGSGLPSGTGFRMYDGDCELILQDGQSVLALGGQARLSAGSVADVGIIGD